jgi:hypothetical protein
MAALDEELGKTSKFSADPSLVPSKRGPLDVLVYKISRINWPKTGLAVLAVLLLGGGFWAVSAWRKAAAADPLAGVKPPVYQPASNSVGGDVLPLPLPPPAPVRRP